MSNIITFVTFVNGVATFVATFVNGVATFVTGAATFVAATFDATFDATESRKLVFSVYANREPSSSEEYARRISGGRIYIREEGSNGEREMAAAFYSVGFKVLDITMNDLVSSKTYMLENCRGLVFVGGFTYSDVFGAGVGWYYVIKHNDKTNL